MFHKCVSYSEISFLRKTCPGNSHLHQLYVLQEEKKGPSQKLSLTLAKCRQLEEKKAQDPENPKLSTSLPLHLIQTTLVIILRGGGVETGVSSSVPAS